MWKREILPVFSDASTAWVILKHDKKNTIKTATEIKLLLIRNSGMHVLVLLQRVCLDCE